MSASLPWVALAVGVAGVGAAAWQERAGSRAVARSRHGPHRGPSLEAIRAAIAPLGMKVRRVEGEYRVVFNDYDATPRGKLDEEMAAYYTTDADDALETARDMARRRAEVIAQRAARKPGARGSRSADADWVDVVGFLQRQSGPRTVPEIVLGVFGAPDARDHEGLHPPGYDPKGCAACKEGARQERAVRRALAVGAKDILNFKGQEYWAMPRSQVNPGRAR